MRRTAIALPLLAALLVAALGVAADGDRASRDDRAGHAQDGTEGDDRRDDRREEDRDEPAAKERKHGKEDQEDEDDGHDERDGEREDGGESDRKRQRDTDRESAGPAADELPVLLSGDVAVRQTVNVDPGRLTYVVAVGGLGVGVAEGVRLAADLPDLGRPWSLTGRGAEACSLDGLRLSCAFGDLAPGDVRLLQVASDIAATPAWEVRTTAAVAAGNDARPGNDAATTVVSVLLT